MIFLQIYIFQLFYTNTYTHTFQDFECFKKISFILTKAAFISSKYSKNSKIVKYSYNLNYPFFIVLYFKIEFIPVMQHWIFSIIIQSSIISSLQCHTKLQKLFLINLMCTWIKAIIHFKKKLTVGNMYIKKKSNCIS